jgi:hypothetical protein
MSKWLKIEAGYLNTDHVVVHYQSIVMTTGTTVELLPNEFKELESMITGIPIPVAKPVRKKKSK